MLVSGNDLTIEGRCGRLSELGLVDVRGVELVMGGGEGAEEDGMGDEVRAADFGGGGGESWDEGGGTGELRTETCPSLLPGSRMDFGGPVEALGAGFVDAEEVAPDSSLHQEAD